MTNLQKVLIVGCGDMGRRVARLVQEDNGQVTAIVRSDARRDALQQIGIRTLTGNLDEPSSLTNLPAKDATVFYFAPPPGGGFADPRVRAFCDAITPGAEPAKIVYMSTSGVYGDCGDSEVTEETPPAPQTARGKRRLDAESSFLEWGRAHNVPVVILRVTGIYGPGRFPVTQLASGQPVLREEEATITNRIHADDLARICLAAAERGDAGEIFNISDGHPGTMTEYFNAVADALGYPRPRQVTREEARDVMSPLMLSYVSESRRMSNAKMLSRLGVKLLYPTLADGMREIKKKN